jgi:predicted esterase
MSSGGVSRRGLVIGSSAIVLGAGAAAAYVYRDEITPSLFTHDDDICDIEYGDGNKGALLEPTSVSTSTPAPLLLLFDPNGLARYIVGRYAAAARKLGWLAASSYDVRNGTREMADTHAMLDLLAFVRQRRAVDAAHVYTGGFSGGACEAYRLAIVADDTFAGAIVECGHMGPWRHVGNSATPRLKFYLFTREGDFNRPATGALFAVMQEKGCRVTKVEHPGVHAPMEGAEVDDALAWMAKEA